jgi:thioredoxin 1
MAVGKLTAANFDTEILKSTQPVVVDFWATWCGPCQMLGPIVEQLGTELSGIKVMKCNVDEEGELAAKFGIESIPALLKFKNGQVAAKSIGFKPKEAIKAFMEG